MPPTDAFPSTKAGADQRASAFFQRDLARYPSQRNRVTSDLRGVSRLSPATRHRLVTEAELAGRAIQAVGRPASEKFCQEVYWRLYWKGFLEQRPSLWDDYLASLSTFPAGVEEQADRLARGESGVAVMDAFARQLVATGYLHNHARMWFAAFWIHSRRLPWQLGARFFQSHLLDGDPASNTLSWRWVAGLQTRGKSYLVRRSNLERFLEPDWLARHAEGLEELDDSVANPAPIEFAELPERHPLPSLPNSTGRIDGRLGLWIHDDDTAFESSPLSSLAPDAIAVGSDARAWEPLAPSLARRAYLDRVLEDTGRRASAHFSKPVDRWEEGDFTSQVVHWVEDRGIKTLACLEPFVGPARSTVESIDPHLEARGIRLLRLRRPEDEAILPLAKAGFFGFWKKASGQIEALAPGSPNEPQRRSTSSHSRGASGFGDRAHRHSPPARP